MSIIENAIDRLRRTSVPLRSTGTAQEGGASGDRTESRGVATTVHRRIAIDLDALRAGNQLPEAGEERRFAEYYREIKRPLIARALASDARPEARLILVTSALPADGKTFTALNLAFSIARERDVSVLLVDGDAPKAHLSVALGVANEPGLLDALSNSALDVESLVLGTDIPGLEILPAGKAAEGAAPELIGSARMGQIAARLTGLHPRRLVLMDSSPLLVSSEARALKQVPGQILMVARAGKTPRQALLDAIALVDKSKLYGLVLNESYEPGAQGYYGYYGYGESGGRSGPAD
ncbi:MAG TPA: CpsD/CapB family tyrosine-protein kinase [Steroidobacteraceae bacterium]|jgi:Mrp family chromosome partitioning ATPase|nr:CpsD/CapB family tyrosine-protein kinase [Steroidobacteraceae bacterium]